MPEPDYSEQIKLAAEAKLADYNQRMATLFAERNTHPVSSPEWDAVAERIMSLWVSQSPVFEHHRLP
jgi:hypothetical protein